MKSRIYSPGRVTVKTRDDGSKSISGYAAVFYRKDNPGTEYQLYGDVYERIIPGAFNRAIAEKHDATATFNHDVNQLLGRVSSGTVLLSVDDVGLRYEITPPDTQTGRDVMALIDRGDISGSSFAFYPTRTTWAVDGDRDIREVGDVELLDVGPVTNPAYKSTTAGIRSAEEIEEARNELARIKGEAVNTRARLVEILEKI